MSHTLRVGARTSPLSIKQTEEVLSLMRARLPAIDFVVVPIVTRGDRDKQTSLQVLGRGVFVKEIELALIQGEIDLAVHSAKDLTASLPDGLTIAAVGLRQDPRDVLVDRWALPLMELPAGARIGTGSPRRVAQIARARPDIRLLPIRGNVGTRLDKARGDGYDGVVIAAAGVIRLGRQSEITEYLSHAVCTPEVGQGTLAIQAREADTATVDMLRRVDDPPTSIALRAERAFQEMLNGGCRTPLAAYARPEGGRVHIASMAALPDGSRLFRADVTCDAGDPEAAGRQAATELLEAGAAEILAEG